MPQGKQPTTMDFRTAFNGQVAILKFVLDGQN